jgi:hypothetical protein
MAFVRPKLAGILAVDAVTAFLRREDFGTLLGFHIRLHDAEGWTPYCGLYEIDSTRSTPAPRTVLCVTEPCTMVAIDDTSTWMRIAWEGTNAVNVSNKELSM